MNSNRSKIALFIVGLVVLSYIILTTKPTIRWHTEFIGDSKQPYGLYLFNTLIREGFPNVTVIENDTLSPSNYFKENTPDLYLYIGEEAYYDSSDLQAILTYLNEGGTALVMKDFMFNYEPDILVDSIRPLNQYGDVSYAIKGMIQDTHSLTFLHPAIVDSFKMVHQYSDELIEGTLLGVSPNYYFDYTPLGSINDSLYSYIQMDYGAGTLFYHWNPEIFTNYYLKQPEGLRYAQNVLNMIPALQRKQDDGLTIFYDTKSRIYTYPDRMDSPPSPIAYILNHKGLRQGWFIFVLGSMLFLIFRAKRKQRPIPIISRPSNTSLNFVKSIGDLYFHQGNHKGIANLKYKHWRNSLWQRYRLPLSDPLDEIRLATIANQLDISPTAITDIIDIQERFDKSHFISEEALISFINKINQFYSATKPS